MRKSYNLDKLIKITLDDKISSSSYTIHKEYRILNIRIRRAGIYKLYGLANWKYKTSDIEKFNSITDNKYMIEDEKIYTKPSCELIFGTYIRKTIYFDNYKQAKKFYNKIIKDKNFKEVS